MATKIPSKLLGNPFSKWELTIKETFSLDGFYTRLHDFLADDKWQGLSGGDDYEVFFSEKDEGGMKFHSIWWRGVKDLDHGNGFFKMYFILDITTVAMKKKEIIHKGQKVELDNGELKVNAQIFLEDNANGTGEEWDGNPILKYFKRQFWNRLNKGASGAAKGDVAKFSNDLYTFIQTYTGILPEGDTTDFTPMKGIEN